MSARSHATNLNLAGVIVLVVGLGSAGLVYRLGQDRSAGQSNPQASASTGTDWQDSTLPRADSKAATRDIELYGGKMEVLMVNGLERLRRPESLAILIAAISTLSALGCFLAARRPPVDVG